VNPVVLVWLQFAVCLALVAAAGPRLSRSGDIIADKTGLSGTWVGLVLVATITSLPELVTGASAVTIADAPDIAVGDVFGSCVFNLAILIVLDFIQRGENVYRRVRQGHVLSAGFGVILIGFAGMNLVLHGQGASFAIGRIGGYTPIIFALYALGMRAVFSYERDHREQAVEEAAARYPDVTLRRAIIAYAGASVMIVAVGTALPFIATRLADVMAWQRSFVGTLLVAAVTSLPELVVSVAAVRIGAVDMAMANLLGSNLFNMLVLGIDDLLFPRGPLLYRVSPVHVVSALSAVIMSGIVIAGLVYRPQRRLFRTVGWISLGLFTMYLLNSYVLYLHGI
jgi:cation:H+ antiporter